MPLLILVLAVILAMYASVHGHDWLAISIFVLGLLGAMAAHDAEEK